MDSGRDRNVFVAQLNNFVHLYLEELGMREQTKQEFIRKAKAANLSLEAFESFQVWKAITEPSQILQTIMGPFEVPHSIGSYSASNWPGIDRNLPRHRQVAAVEDEGSTNGIDCTLRL